MSARLPTAILLTGLALAGCDLQSLVSLPHDGGALLACADGTARCGEDCVSVQADPANCGACGVTCAATETCAEGACRLAACGAASSCPAPVHAAAVCVGGRCGRGPCASGFFDFDGPATFGCETACLEKLCRFPDGGSVRVTNEPLPESGPVFQVMASGSSFGAQVQTNARFTNLGVLGEPTPAALGGVAAQTSPGFRNVAGFGPVQGR